MNTETSNRIKYLLSNSGLLSNHRTVKKAYLSYDFSNETILITGAAGSIGSELIKQLQQSKFKKIIALDNAETPLFLLKQKTPNNISIKFVLGDIRDQDTLKSVFNLYKPTFVFHTAAYKHVSIVEDNPFQAIKTNVFATETLSKLAIENKIKKFIFISTDKAVKPKGIMGMTKLISENYLSELNSKINTTDFISARFGNVFGSNGSVVPLYLERLNRGEKILVSDKEASRYFIDIAEAGDLILKLASLKYSNYSKASFKMGKPIKIMDLAKVLVSMFNKTLSESIEMSKLSKGEKLNESLISDYEELIDSSCENIFFISDKTPNQNPIDFEKINQINAYTESFKIEDILKQLSNY